MRAASVIVQARRLATRLIDRAPPRVRVLWRPPIGAAGDAALIRRATLVVAAQTAAAVAVVVAVVSLIALGLTTRSERDDTDSALRQAAQTARTTAEAPPGVWLLIQRPAAPAEASAGAPPRLSELDPARLRPGHGQVELGHDAHYELYTVDRAGTRVVAVTDRRFGDRERERLLGALLAAGAAGIVAAGAVSWLVAARAVRPLGSALAMQRRFVADASHELRTPLTILHTRAQLLQRRTSADAELAPAVDRLVAGTRTLTEIVNDLLLSAELQARPAHTSRVDLAEIAAAVADEFAPPAQHAGVHLHVRAETPVPVAGVAVALRRAVSALVDNALGHSHAGGTVTIEARLHEESALLIVTDDGEGIDPAAVRALTERFTRGPSASGRGRRFGLGLALVTEVVHSHGGALALHGMPGVGTTATITLPAAAATG